MNIDEKLTLLRAVEQSGFSVIEACERLDIPRTTYYRWRSKFKYSGKLYHNAGRSTRQGIRSVV